MVKKIVKHVAIVVLAVACIGTAYYFPETGFMAFIVGFVFGIPVAIAGYFFYCYRHVSLKKVRTLKQNQ